MVSRGIAVLFLGSRDSRWEWRGQPHAPASSTPGKDPVPIVQEVGWAPGPVWSGAENLSPNGIRSPDRPGSSSVAIPTELPNSIITNCNGIKSHQMSF